MLYEIVPLQNSDKKSRFDMLLIEKDSGNFKGVGNFCGWYGAEYYSNFRMIGCLDDDLATPIRTDGTIYAGEVQIQSVYQNTQIEADTDDEAYEKFCEFVKTFQKRV